MAVGTDYSTPVTVNGFSCRNCTDVDYAKKHIDPAHPKSGPYGINAKDDPSGWLYVITSDPPSVYEQVVGNLPRIWGPEFPLISTPLPDKNGDDTTPAELLARCS